MDVTVPIVHEDQKDSQTLIIICILAAFVAVVAITVVVLVYMRGARRVAKDGRPRELPERRGAAAQLPARLHDSQREQLNMRR